MKKAKTLGILGGGQLGRMSAQAAHKLGIKTLILTPEEDSPASQVADDTIIASYDDTNAVEQFAARVDVISYEFENIPVETVKHLKRFTPVYPDESLLAVTQDRIAEKTFLNSIDIPTAKWASVTAPEDITRALKTFGAPSAILKTIRFGYDGKGQLKHNSGENINNSWESLGQVPLIAEEIIDFDFEISVIVARDHTGHTIAYPPVLNEHENHILSKTIAPAPVPQNLAKQAQDLAVRLAEKVNLRGVLALELFVTREGKLLANEIAPRTHNSGHWSIDACAVSQFENHVRAVCGLPVLDPGQHHEAVMINLIGEDVKRAEEFKTQKNACVHLYGKHDTKPGRKMGHVTILGKKIEGSRNAKDTKDAK